MRASATLALPQTLTHGHVAAFIGVGLIIGTAVGGYASVSLGKSFLSELRLREAALVFSAVESGPLTFARLQSADIAQAQLNTLMGTAGIHGRPIIGARIQGGKGGRFEFAKWKEARPVGESCLTRETRSYSFPDALHPYQVTLESDRCLRLPEERLILRNALVVGLLVSLLASLAGLMAIMPVIDSFLKARLMLQNPLSPEPLTIRFLPLRELALLAFRGSQAERNEALAKFAQQVAHDIRSPLAALEVATGDRAFQVPQDKRELIGDAVGRIRDIANSLLEKHRSLAAGADIFRMNSASSIEVVDLEPLPISSLIESLIAEKRLEFSGRPHLAIAYRPNASSSGTLAKVQPVEFKRLLSNLINNSAEALGEDGGSVDVSLSALDFRTLVSVKDDGKGIPPEVLTSLGRRGGTFGKNGGSGLGLHHARASVESWGGTLEISSVIGKGTTVNVFIPEVRNGDARRTLFDAVLIDDDELARATWKVAASRLGKRLRSYATAGEFLGEADAVDRATPVYIDVDLGNGKQGDVESLKIHELGFREIYLVTGHEPGKFAGLAHLRGVVGKEPPWGRAGSA